MSTQQDQKPSQDVLLVLRTPPPHGGGEIIAEELRHHFQGTYDVLLFRRREHSKPQQGRLIAANLLFALTYLEKTIGRIIHRRPKVLYIDLPKDALSFTRTVGILLICFFLGIRVIGDLAGSGFLFLRSNPVSRKCGLFLLRRVHRIRVLSNSIGEDLARDGLTNTVAIPNGIRDPLQGNGVPDPGAETLHCLYVGKIAVSKGIWTILRFAERWSEERRGSIHIHLAGEWESDDTRRDVTDFLKEKGLEDTISNHGLVLEEAKWALFRQCHFLIHPTFWDGQPVTILEAFSFGIPVIATKIGAIPETVQHGVNGWLMEVNTADEVDKAVKAIASDTETYRAYRTAARCAYENAFTAERFAARMGALFQSALHQGDAEASTRALEERKRVHDLV